MLKLTWMVRFSAKQGPIGQQKVGTVGGHIRYPFQGQSKRASISRMTKTGDPYVVKRFWKRVSLIRKMIVIFSKYIMIEIVTVSAVKGWNREKTITTLGTAAPDWKKHWAVGESITRNIR